jgi:hypothetical protein
MHPIEFYVNAIDLFNGFINIFIQWFPTLGVMSEIGINTVFFKGHGAVDSD